MIKKKKLNFKTYFSVKSNSSTIRSLHYPLNRYVQHNNCITLVEACSFYIFVDGWPNDQLTSLDR